MLVAIAFGIFAKCAERAGISSRLPVLAMIVSPGVAAAMVSDFHEVALGAPLLALSCSAYARRDWKKTFWWALPLLLAKEDAGLMNLGMAVALWCRGQRARGLVLSAVSVCWMALAVLVFIPSMNDGGSYTYVSTSGISGKPRILATKLIHSLIWPGWATMAAAAMIAVAGGEGT